MSAPEGRAREYSICAPRTAVLKRKNSEDNISSAPSIEETQILSSLAAETTSNYPLPNETFASGVQPPTQHAAPASPPASHADEFERDSACGEEHRQPNATASPVSGACASSPAASHVNTPQSSGVAHDADPLQYFPAGRALAARQLASCGDTDAMCARRVQYGGGCGPMALNTYFPAAAPHALAAEVTVGGGYVQAMPASMYSQSFHSDYFEHALVTNAYEEYLHPDAQAVPAPFLPHAPHAHMGLSMGDPRMLAMASTLVQTYDFAPFHAGTCAPLHQPHAAHPRRRFYSAPEPRILIDAALRTGDLEGLEGILSAVPDNATPVALADGVGALSSVNDVFVGPDHPGSDSAPAPQQHDAALPRHNPSAAKTSQFVSLQPISEGSGSATADSYPTAPAPPARRKPGRPRGSTTRAPPADAANGNAAVDSDDSPKPPKPRRGRPRRQSAPVPHAATAAAAAAPASGSGESPSNESPARDSGVSMESIPRASASAPKRARAISIASNGLSSSEMLVAQALVRRRAPSNTALMLDLADGRRVTVPHELLSGPLAAINRFRDEMDLDDSVCAQLKKERRKIKGRRYSADSRSNRLANDDVLREQVECYKALLTPSRDALLAVAARNFQDAASQSTIAAFTDQMLSLFQASAVQPDQAVEGPAMPSGLVVTMMA